MHEAGSSVSFKALQKHIEGVPETTAPATNSNVGFVSASNRSFDNPLFDNNQLPENNSSYSIREKELNKNPQPSLLSSLPKSTSGASIRSIRSTKSFKSLLGFSREVSAENPMVDISVDIGMEASKFDPLGAENKVEPQSEEAAQEAKEKGKEYLKVKLV